MAVICNFGKMEKMKEESCVSKQEGHHIRIQSPQFSLTISTIFGSYR